MIINNYHIIAVTLINILFKSFVSIIPSVGNLLVEKNKSKNYDVFKKMFFVNSFLVGLFSICFMATINSFISVWVGEKYLLTFDTVIAFSLYIVIDGVRYTIMTFRDGAGICVEDRNTYIIAIFINLICSILLCHYCGLIGVIIGTSLAYLFLDIYSYPKYTFKVVFDEPVKNYFMIYFKFICELIISSIVVILITNIININSNIFQFIVYGLVSSIVWTVIYILFNKKNKEYYYYKQIIFKLVKRKKD